MDSENFEISGDDWEETIQVSLYGRGFTTRLRIGHELSTSVIHCEPLTFLGVTIYTNVTKIAINTVLMNFKVVNGNSTAQTVSFETNADIHFDNNDFAPVQDYKRQGFIIYSERHAISFLGKNWPLVDDVSTYWFGYHSMMASDLWKQGLDEALYGSDSAFAFTWQNVTIQPGQHASRSAIMKWGVPVLNVIEMTIDTSPFGTHVYIGATLRLTAHLWSNNPAETASILLVLDGDSSMVYRLADREPVNVNFQFDLVLSHLHIGTGVHTFGFYAIDDVGTLTPVHSVRGEVTSTPGTPTVHTATTHAPSVLTATPHAPTVHTATPHPPTVHTATTHAPTVHTATPHPPTTHTRSRSIHTATPHNPPTATAPAEHHATTRPQSATRKQTTPPRTRTTVAQTHTRSRSPLPTRTRSRSVSRSIPSRTRISYVPPASSSPLPLPTYPPGLDEGDAGHAISPGGIAGIVIGLLVVGAIVVVIVVLKKRSAGGSLRAEDPSFMTGYTENL
jgi:hypothetical protein